MGAEVTDGAWKEDEFGIKFKIYAINNIYRNIFRNSRQSDRIECDYGRDERFKKFSWNWSEHDYWFFDEEVAMWTQHASNAICCRDAINNAKSFAITIHVDVKSACCIIYEYVMQWNQHVYIPYNRDILPMALHQITWCVNQFEHKIKSSSRCESVTIGEQNILALVRIKYSFAETICTVVRHECLPASRLICGWSPTKIEQLKDTMKKG